MSIVIKEIILSDNIEKFMEKVNFNFDQLMLAGGGPQGPIGPQGLIGPGGPKGDPGNKWYVGCTPTSADILSTFGAIVLDGDLFLQNEDCGPSWYPPAQILEYDFAGSTFTDTGLNIMGPTGAKGETGDNTGWGTYKGDQSGSIYLSTNINSAGPTANFAIMIGDTSNFLSGVPAGITAGLSRDILFLGGQDVAQQMNKVWPLERLPKMVVNPRWGSQISYAGYTAGGGQAGGGIALGWENNINVSPAPLFQQEAWSNIFVDDQYNLHITSFSDHGLSVGSSIENMVSLESLQKIQLIGTSYKVDDSSYLQVGRNLAGATWNNPDMNPSLAPMSGALISTRNTSQYEIIRNEIEDTGQIQFFGGANPITPSFGQTIDGIDLGRPQTAFFSDLPNLNETSVYRIAISPSKTNKHGTDTQYYMPFISSGLSPSPSIIANGCYLGLGANYGDNGGGGRSPHGGLFVYGDSFGNLMDTDTMGDKILLGNIYTNLDTNFSNLKKYSLDTIGSIRMREGAGNGKIIVDPSTSGLMEWSKPEAAGIPIGTGTSPQLTYWTGATTQGSCADTQWNAGSQALGLGIAGISRLSTAHTIPGQAFLMDDTSAGVDRILTCIDGVGRSTWKRYARGTKVELFPAGTHTWTPIAGAVAVEVICIAGGGGGGAGCWHDAVGMANHTAILGGGGGQGGGYSHETLRVSLLNATETVIVGAGGGGGNITGAMSNTAVYGSGNPGAASSFGDSIYAYGGAGGDAGRNELLTGFLQSWHGPPAGSAAEEGVATGNVLADEFVPFYWIGPPGPGQAIDFAQLYKSNGGGDHTGGAGGTAQGSYFLNDVEDISRSRYNGRPSKMAPSGGGAGGSQLNLATAPYSGIRYRMGDGGNVQNTNTLGGDAGVDLAVNGHGSVGENSDGGGYAGAGGGGGAVAHDNFHDSCYYDIPGLDTYCGWNGGSGGLYGGGGGGGGAGYYGPDFISYCGPGDGGNGANGIVVVISHF